MLLLLPMLPAPPAVDQGQQRDRSALRVPHLRRRLPHRPGAVSVFQTVSGSHVFVTVKAITLTRASHLEKARAREKGPADPSMARGRVAKEIGLGNTEVGITPRVGEDTAAVAAGIGIEQCMQNDAERPTVSLASATGVAACPG